MEKTDETKRETPQGEQNRTNRAESKAEQSASTARSAFASTRCAKEVRTMAATPNQPEKVIEEGTIRVAIFREVLPF